MMAPLERGEHSTPASQVNHKSRTPALSRPSKSTCQSWHCSSPVPAIPIRPLSLRS